MVSSRSEKQEFFRLRQFGKTATKYETELRELVEFVHELANFEKYLCSKFEERLSLEIRENMSISSNQSYKKVVQLALKAKKLISEKMSQAKFQKRKGFWFISNQYRRKVVVLNL